MRAAEAAANPASQQEVDTMLQCLKRATGSAPLQQRVLEMMRLQEEVGMQQPLQPPFIKAGGITALLDVAISGWPKGSNVAEPQHESNDVVLVLPVKLDVELVGRGPCTGQRHLGIRGQAQPLHRSLRRAALCAVAEMSNYSIIIDAIHEDGRLFDAKWLPQRLQQVMQCSYGLNYYEATADSNQVHTIAERLLYPCGNSCGKVDVARMLNSYCSLLVIKSFRDQWQRKHEPLEHDHRSSSGGSSRPDPLRRRRPHPIPDKLAPGDPMTDIAYDMAASEALAIREQKLAWVKAGAVAKGSNTASSSSNVRAVAAHANSDMRASASLDLVLQLLRPAWQEQARHKALRQAQEEAQGKAAAEQLCVVGNVAYKAGQLQQALQH
ncbi:hypothetical protein COO60DRAFT_1679937 [Scenedesmus sp. NREL 46B-D3]|nr:hypothetical protein COO60DRAFT_1679937 [Scenedesmus sp. NREL 46B-D3]